MLGRSVAALVVALAVGGLVLAEETFGFVTKVEDGTITLRTGGGFGKKKVDPEDKTFKVGRDVKIIRIVGKDKDEVKLTLDELKTAVKVTNVFVTVVHEGENGSEIRTGGFGFGKGKGKGKKKKKDD